MSQDVYTCGYCSLASSSEVEMAAHEKQHTCSHDGFYKFKLREACDDVYWFNTKGIVKLCLTCDTKVDEVSFEGMELHFGLMEQVFNAIKNHELHEKKNH